MTASNVCKFCTPDKKCALISNVCQQPVCKGYKKDKLACPFWNKHLRF